MIQNPETISRMLATLREITQEQATFLLVRDELMRVVVLGVNRDGSLKLHGTGTEFTRTLAEAHSNARRNRDKEGGAHDAPVTAKPEQTQTETLSSQLDLDTQSAAVSTPILTANALKILAIPVIADALPNVRGKIEDALHSLADIDAPAAKAFLSGALTSLSTLEAAVYE